LQKNLTPIEINTNNPTNPIATVMFDDNLEFSPPDIAIKNNSGITEPIAVFLTFLFYF